MKKRTLALLLALWTLTILAGCGGEKKEEAPIEELPTVEEAEPEPEPEPYVPMGTNPLTGLPMEVEYENDRPVAVMFNNIEKALPQLGVSQADIIYEIPAEGDVTRMMGVFQSMEGVGDLGSIRSTRPYYLEAALGLDALLVHAGGSPDAYENISAWGVSNMDGVRGGVRQEEMFWRDKERRQEKGYEHSLLTSGKNIQDYLAEDRCRTEHKDEYEYIQAFADDGTPENGTTAEYFKLYFTSYKTGVFEYEDKTGCYLISQYKKPYIDGNTGEQVSAVNVLILETDISVIPGDAEGRLTVRMSGSGQGTYFCGGKCIPIRWSKENRNSQFTYTMIDGKPLIMGKGNSYVCVMDPGNSRLEITD